MSNWRSDVCASDLALQPQASAASGSRVEGRRVQGGFQGTDGALSSLAGQARTRAGGSLPAGGHPLHSLVARADRIAGVGQVGHPQDRKTAVSGQSVSLRVVLGWRAYIKKKKNKLFYNMQ